jgi:hypothetical protein
VSAEEFWQRFRSLRWILGAGRHRFLPGKSLAQERQAFDGDFVAGGFDLTPDRGGAGDDFDLGREGFDDAAQSLRLRAHERWVMGFP